jgi:hypothetical protein
MLDLDGIARLSGACLAGAESLAGLIDSAE